MPETVSKFVQDDDFFRTNAHNQTYSSDANREDERLREKAKIWFKDDYQFYNAATEVFQGHIASADMNPNKMIQSCPIWPDIITPIEEI